MDDGSVMLKAEHHAIALKGLGVGGEDFEFFLKKYEYFFKST